MKQGIHYKELLSEGAPSMLVLWLAVSLPVCQTQVVPSGITDHATTVLGKVVHRHGCNGYLAVWNVIENALC